MKYLRDREGENNNFFYILLLFIIIVFFFWKDSFLGVASRFSFAVSVPFWKVGEYISDNLAYVMVAFNEKAELIRTNKAIRSELSIARIRELQNKLLEEENFELKKMLSRSFEIEDNSNISKGNIIKKTKLEPLLGYVLAGPATPPFDNLVVDIGADFGASVGDLVVNSDGYLIGKVVELGNDFSKIKLFSSYGDKTQIFLGENKTMVDMIGLGSGNFFVSLPKDFSIKIGDPAWYPGGNSMIIAEVKDIEYKEGETFKKVFLAYSFNSREIRILGVLKNIK